MVMVTLLLVKIIGITSPKRTAGAPFDKRRQFL